MQLQIQLSKVGEVNIEGSNEDDNNDCINASMIIWLTKVWRRPFKESNKDDTNHSNIAKGKNNCQRLGGDLWSEIRSLPAIAQVQEKGEIANADLNQTQ